MILVGEELERELEAKAPAPVARFCDNRVFNLFSTPFNF